MACLLGHCWPLSSPAAHADTRSPFPVTSPDDNGTRRVSVHDGMKSILGRVEMTSMSCLCVLPCIPKTKHSAWDEPIGTVHCEPAPLATRRSRRCALGVASVGVCLRSLFRSRQSPPLTTSPEHCKRVISRQQHSFHSVTNRSSSLVPAHFYSTVRLSR